MPSRGRAWRFSGRCWPNLASRSIASRFARPAAGDVVDGGWVTVSAAAGELLPHGLDDLPLDRLDLERLGDVLAQLGQLATAAGTGGRRRQDHPLARQVGRQGRAHRLATGRAAERPSLSAAFSALAACLAGGGHLAELELQLVDQLAAALETRACRA